MVLTLTGTFDTTTISGLSGSTKWLGGVLAPNGKIYGIPRDSTSVLIIDPVTNTADTTTIAGLSGTIKWEGGVLAPNGKIYAIPRNSTSVLIIDPVANTADTTTIAGGAHVSLTLIVGGGSKLGRFVRVGVGEGQRKTASVSTLNAGGRVGRFVRVGVGK